MHAQGSEAAFAAERPSPGTLALFSVPIFGLGFLQLLQMIYLFKYATDVLLIAPAAMGLIFMVGRFWDAASDPIAGYLSDRTRTRWGRRRPWLFAAAPLLAVAPLLTWSPPHSLEGVALALWVGAGLVLLETAFTLLYIPHAALGAELSLAHHERTRVFGYRQVALHLGFFCAVPGMSLLIEAGDRRAAAFWLMLAGGLGSAALVALAAARLREREAFQGRGGARPLSALRDVLRNPHARLLLVVLLIENIGQASLLILVPYHAQYVVGDESLLPLVSSAYMVTSLLVVPIGLPLSRRMGKKRLWAWCMALSGSAYGLMFFAGPGDALYVCACAALIGVGNGIGLMVGPSVQADIVDYDELVTGERKEGMYFATLNFVRKAASAITGFLTGLALQWVGFVPNIEQTETTKLAIRSLQALFPFASFALGLALFLRFRLGESEHARIRAQLARRARALTGVPPPP
jgi:GPH family glycoside/pentoside/hexuronide:cation symporter